MHPCFRARETSFLRGVRHQLESCTNCLESQMESGILPWNLESFLGIWNPAFKRNPPSPGNFRISPYTTLILCLITYLPMFFSTCRGTCTCSFRFSFRFYLCNWIIRLLQAIVRAVATYQTIIGGVRIIENFQVSYSTQVDIHSALCICVN